MLYDEAYSKLLSAESLGTIAQVFEECASDDLIASRFKVADALMSHPLMMPLLDEAVFYIKAIDSRITVRQVIRQMNDDLVSDRNLAEYVTWSEVEAYFSMLRKTMAIRVTTDVDKEYDLQIDPDYLRQLRDVFDTVPRVLDGFVVRDDFFKACLADVQVAAVLEEKAFDYKDEKTERTVTETIRQALYRLSVEMKEVISWLDVVKFLSCPEYSREDAVRETRWKYLADHAFIDEKGILNKEFNDRHSGLRIMNQPLGISNLEAQNRSAVKNKISKTVTFEENNGDLYGDPMSSSKRPTSTQGQPNQGPAYQIRRSQTASKSGVRLAAHQTAFETAVKEDPNFSEKDYHNQKKQLLERYRLKNITVVQVLPGPQRAQMCQRKAKRDDSRQKEQGLLAEQSRAGGNRDKKQVQGERDSYER